MRLRGGSELKTIGIGPEAMTDSHLYSDLPRLNLDQELMSECKIDLERLGTDSPKWDLVQIDWICAAAELVIK